MNGTGEHDAKWNKPGGEGQIPYDLTFNWNIIIKRKNKQNITRDIEIKNNLTIEYAFLKEFENTFLFDLV